MHNSFFSWMLLIAAIWCFVNGLLHDIFILKNHTGPYNRDLLRLLMDGHVLLLSGIIYFVCFLFPSHPSTIISLVIAVFMIIYCIMIFPFLKSFVTLFINLSVCAGCLYALYR